MIYRSIVYEADRGKQCLSSTRGVAELAPSLP